MDTKNIAFKSLLAIHFGSLLLECAYSIAQAIIEMNYSVTEVKIEDGVPVHYSFWAIIRFFVNPTIYTISLVALIVIALIPIFQWIGKKKKERQTKKIENKTK